MKVFFKKLGISHYLGCNGTLCGTGTGASAMVELMHSIFQSVSLAESDQLTKMIQLRTVDNY